MELAILRLGAFEILFSDNIPDRVAINEAVELTKLLGAHEGHKYVNGVLDKIARRRAGDMDRKAVSPTWVSEFDLIRRFFADVGPARSDVALGVGDDCALLQVPAES